MILKDKIATLAEGFLEGTDKFIMEVDVKPGNLIIVTIDGDSLVTIDDCIKLSRSIENSLDRDAEDFELRVRSYGADSPLVQPRQYNKHIGRELDITLYDESKIQGHLREVTNDGIIITLKKGKKKDATEEERVLKFDEIERAGIILSFK